MKQLRKRYYWKIISNDGLLKDPPKFGAYYDERDLNGYSGFDSEQDAIKEFMHFNSLYEYEFREDYTLVCIYDVIDSDWV